MKKPVNHIVEADIKGFFDNVNHDMLLDFLNIRIKDTSLLFLIKRFLKAGYIDNNLLVTSEDGTPQGSILSPILANIFLHYVLDTWFEQQVKTHTKGYCEFVRYADDCIYRSIGTPVPETLGHFDKNIF
jgi:retron-type reverse transcriptase